MTGQLFSQTTTGTIHGSVAGNDEVRLADVKITIVNGDSNSSRSVASDRAGNYQITLLPPGAYRVEAEVEGFNKAIRS